MKEIVKATIDRIYTEKDYEYYLSQCKKELLLDNAFSKLLECYSALDHIQLNVNPSYKWYFQLERVTKGEFNASFNTTLLISKVAPVFYVQHEFEVENKDVTGVAPVLDGFGGQPYSKAQFELHSQINENLTSQGYVELNIDEINEVVPNLSFKDGVSIFGSQVTVEYALFHDILELCPE